jgi:GDP-4-dehydro-6-deoxy-D-mannose reductase
MTTRRVVITGAQGFIGRYLVTDWLVADPRAAVIGVGRSARLDGQFTHDVGWGEARLPAPLPTSLANVVRQDRYHYVTLDLADRASLTRLLADIQPDIVVHLASALRDDPPTELVRANIGTVASLLEAASEAHLRAARIVLGSSGSVYGHVPGRVPPLSEDAACAPIDPYSVTKRAAETLSKILADTYGVPVLWARIFNPVGPGQDERHVCGWLGRQVAAIASGVQAPTVSVGSLDTTRDFIDVRDTATAIRVVATRGEPGTIYNVASGRETSGQQVLDMLLDLAGLTGRVLVERRPGRPNDTRRHYADVARLVALGYSPTFSLSDSLTHVLEYYRECVSRAVAVLFATAGRDSESLSSFQ